MPRTSLISFLCAVAALGASTAWPQSTPDPHLDRSLVTGGCSACHVGHGVSRSPMLPRPQAETCYECHGNRTDLDRMVARGAVRNDADPQLLSSTLDQPFLHPLDAQARSRHEEGVVTCSSCHSPHRGRARRQTGPPDGIPKESTRNRSKLEYQLCETCHGAAGVTAQSVTDISRLFTPENPSYHPVEATSSEGSPSVIPALSGQRINCTDCHGNSEPTGPAGPHGSGIQFILRQDYVTADGTDESPTTYRLCYSCHRRKMVLEGSPFPGHNEHVVELKASCATCHSAHGSVEHRALIRFGEETAVGGVLPSLRTGVLDFVSDGPGSGACYLTCHGVDHDPRAYGPMKTMLEMQRRTGLPSRAIADDEPEPVID